MDVCGDTAILGPCHRGNTAHVLEREGTVWLQKTTLQLAPWNNQLFFGCPPVAISENTIVVGRPGSENGAGLVQIFVRDGEEWALQQTLLSPNPDPETGFDNIGGGRFGTSVDISTDLIVVGAPYERPVQQVYVFERVGAEWKLQAELNRGGMLGCGRSVSIDGETIVDGCPVYSGSNLSAGAARVFVRDESGWIEEAFLEASNPTDFANFGEAVTIFGDTVGIGAPGRGAAYIFERSAGVLAGNRFANRLEL